MRYIPVAAALMAIGFSHCFDLLLTSEAKAGHFCPTCAAPAAAGCACRPAVPDRCVPELPPMQPVEAQAGTRPDSSNGAYVRPRHHGESVGESHSLGIRGGALHIPSSTIRLPWLQLPSGLVFRREAHLLTDVQEAPYVDDGISELTGTPKAGRPDQSNEDEEEQSGERRPSCSAPSVPGSEAALLHRIDQLTAQMTQMQSAMEAIARLQSESQLQATSRISPTPTIQTASMQSRPPEPQRLDHQVSIYEHLSLKAAYEAQSAEMQRIQAKLSGFEKGFEKLEALQKKVLSQQPQSQQAAPAIQQPELDDSPEWDDEAPTFQSGSSVMLGSSTAAEPHRARLPQVHTGGTSQSRLARWFNGIRRQ